MKLGSLRYKLIWRIERDPNHPHLIELYDIFGRRIMIFDAQRNCGTYDGDGKHWEDGNQEYARP